MKQRNHSRGRAGFAQMTREERLQAFKNTIFEHFTWLRTRQVVQKTIREPGGASMVFVFGPAGAGKTTLKNFLARSLQIQMPLASWESREQRPILQMLAGSLLHGSFNRKDFLIGHLSLVTEQLIDHDVTFDTDNVVAERRSTRHSQIWTMRRSLTMTQEDMRVALEITLKRCCSLTAVIDDAQHLGKVGRGRQLQDQLDCIKSLATITETVHVLISPYELLAL